MLRLTVAALAVCVVSGCAKCKQLPIFNFEIRLARQEVRRWNVAYFASLGNIASLHSDRQDLQRQREILREQHREQSKSELMQIERGRYEQLRRDELRNPAKLVTDTNLRTTQRLLITSIEPDWEQLAKQAPKRLKLKREKQQQRENVLDEYEREYQRYRESLRADEDRRRENQATGKKCCRCNECCCKCPPPSPPRKPLMNNPVYRMPMKVEYELVYEYDADSGFREAFVEREPVRRLPCTDCGNRDCVGCVTRGNEPSRPGPHIERSTDLEPPRPEVDE